MSNAPEDSIHTLIERSSLGSARALAARSRVPLAKGQEMARAAAARAVDRRSRTETRQRRLG